MAWDHPGGDAVRLWDVDRILFGPGFEAPGPELVDHVVPRERLCGRAGDMWLARQIIGHAARARGVGNGEEPLLEAVLRRGGDGAKRSQHREDDEGSHDGRSRTSVKTEGAV